MRWLARLLFYPTYFWNFLINRVLRLRDWWNWIDDNVLLGARPETYDVKRLKELGITGVVNTCEEYCGPQEAYSATGIEQLYIPTTDFVPPSYENVVRGVEFIDKHIQNGGKVYIHCKAGRGRSATIAICYLIARGHTPESGQKLLLEKRPHVVKTLAQREVVQRFYKERSAK